MLKKRRSLIFSIDFILHLIFAHSCVVQSEKFWLGLKIAFGRVSFLSVDEPSF